MRFTLLSFSQPWLLVRARSNDSHSASHLCRLRWVIDHVGAVVPGWCFDYEPV